MAILYFTNGAKCGCTPAQPAHHTSYGPYLLLPPVQHAYVEGGCGGGASIVRLSLR